MKRRGRSLQLVVLAPVLVLMIVAGAALYLLVLRTVGGYADQNIRATQDSLAGGAFAIADAEYDQQTYEGKLDNLRWTLLFKLNARIRFEDFAREQEIGLIVETGGKLDFVTGLGNDDAGAILRLAPTVGAARLQLPGGGDFYARPIAFAPWDWRIILVKDASAFEALVSEVRAIYAGSAVLLLVVTLVLVFWLRQVLVRPIFRIAGDFGKGSAPDYKGVRELEFLSDNIGGMMTSLQEKTLHLETTLESMSDAITVFDPDMNLVAWNPQFARLYRYPVGFVREGLNFAEIMHYNIERGDYGDVDHEAYLARLVERARNMDPPSFEVERADGTSIEIRRARMPDGGYVTTYTDVTDRRKAEAAEIAQQKAEAANEFKSAFLENMSHDLSSPVKAITSYTGLAMRGMGGNSSRPKKEVLDEVRRNLGNVLEIADHVLKLTDSLLEISRIEAGQITARPESFAADELVRDSLSIAEHGAAAKGIELATDIGEGLNAHTDRGLLKRIVVNLLGNAVRFTKDGAITVSAGVRDGTLEIAVSDTGIGIPADRLDSIFEKFEQVVSNLGHTKVGQEGLGLGLTISRDFAHLLGGAIAVESVPGVGSTFTVTVPLEYREDAQ